MTIFGTRPYWLKYETQDLSKVPFWKLYIAALARPMLIDDEDFGDAEYGEKGKVSRIYNLGLRLSGRDVENPAYDKPVYYFLDYITCPEYDERIDTPYEHISEGYKLYGMRHEYLHENKIKYRDYLVYAKDENQAIKSRREPWVNYYKVTRIFIFPMFYNETISYEFENKDDKCILKETHKRKNIDNY